MTADPGSATDRPSSHPMKIRLRSGEIDYVDTGGEGPVLVLVHGLLMDESLWDEVMADLAPDYRCIAPILPLGAHRRPMSPDADLSLHAIATLVVELIVDLDLREVTLVGNDTGGAVVQLVAPRARDRLARLVLVSCDAFDNFPPGLTGKTVVLLGRLPAGLFGLFMQQMRLRPMRRSPIAFGWLTKRGDAATRRWLTPLLHQREIRRDAVKVLRSIRSQPNLLMDAVPSLKTFDRPALVIWASEDKVMPVEHGHRLADLLPHGRFVEIADSYTLVPLDQPKALADHIRSQTRPTQSTANANPARPSSSAVRTAERAHRWSPN